MTDEVVVTELIIDARGAEAGSAAYVRAMKAAQGAVDKVIEQQNAATIGIEKQTVVMTKSTGSISAVARAWERLKASVDPAYRATKEVEKAMLDADAAARKLGIDGAEVARVMDLVKAKQAGATSSITASATASKLAGYELRNLKFQLIDIAQSIPLAFQSPLYFLQNVGFQFAQIGQIFMGRGGMAAAISQIGSMLGGIASRFARFGAVLAGVALGFNEIRDAASEAEKRQVGWGETFTATFQTIGNYIRGSSLGSVFDFIATNASYALKKLGSAAVDIAELVINSFRAAYYDITAVFSAFPDALGAYFVSAANNGISALNMLVKGASDAVDKISSALNNLPGVDIPLLNASDQSIKLFDNKYLENLKKQVQDRNAAIEKIMKSTPIRDFGQAVVDQIATNHALEGLDALANVDFGKSIGGVNALGSALGSVGKAASGVTVEFGAMQQEAINVTRLFQDAKRSQLIQLEQAQQQLIGMKQQASELQKTLEAAAQTPVDKVFGDMFSGSGGVQAISNAVSTIDKLFTAFDQGRQTVGGVHDAIEMVRASLIQMGGDARSIDSFINKIVNGELQVRQLKSGVDSLSQSIKAIPNRTVTITVKTVGSGTMSQYSVPSTYGGAESAGTGSSYGVTGSSTVGVTRYSSNGPAVSSTPIFNTSTNSWGYTQPKTYQDPRVLAQVAAMYPQRAAGGPISPSSPYWVGEHGPELVVPRSAATVIPNAQSMALATSQTSPDQDKLTAAITDTAVNTKKTAQILDDIKTTGASTFSSGSSSSGSSPASGGTERDPKYTAYLAALKIARSNFAAAGIVGAGNIGYGMQGLAATPAQIAHRAVYGFSTGGMMGPGNGDTQKVEFFKKPSERVIIADPDQFEDRRGGAGSGESQRPIVHLHQTVRSDGAAPSRESLASLKQAAALGVVQGLREYNGRG